MVKKTIVTVASLALIVVAAIWIYGSFSKGSLNFDLNPYNALGAGTAEETARLLGSQGRVVVIIPDSSEFKNPAEDAQLKSFQQTLKKSGPTLAATVNFKLSPSERMASGGAVPRDQFLAALQDHTNAAAVVLFCGFPPLTSHDHDTLKQRGTKLVVVAGYTPAYRKLLEARVIHLAIVPRFDRSGLPTKTPGTLREWFESEFVVITPDNTATLPY